MEHIHRKRGVANGRPAMSAVLLASVWIGSCQPGTLPCDKEEWKEICFGDGGTSSTGGTGGGGGMAGAGGGPPACTKYTTARQVAEMQILPGCGGPMGMACHNPNNSSISFDPKFKTVDEIVPALLDKTPALLCKSDKYINKADPAKSFFVHKVKGTASM